jgi:uncharacterized protein YegL
MGTTDMPGGTSRWNFAKEAAGSLARKAATIDTDGIGVAIFGGSSVKMYDNVTGTDELLNKIFTENEPDGGTPTHKMISTVVDKYLADKAAGKNPKPVLLAIITDGEPSDRKATKQVLVDTANKLDADGEVAITFLQVGNDPSATAFLKELDDELVPTMKAKFDIVDTKQLEGAETITEKLLAAIND